MRYAARLKGDEHALARIAPHFSSAIASIRKRETEWILESVEFERCNSGGELFEAADALISYLNQVLALYLSLYSAFSTDFILVLNDKDHLIHYHIRATGTINVYAQPEQIFGPANSGNLGTRVLSRAFTDAPIKEALALAGHEEFTWPRIYDIIEFLGGIDEIVKSGLAARSKTRAVKQTANHYRHLGRRKPHPLPPNPPSLHEARLFATQLLQKWIARRL